jgi:hypothetical protein
MKEAEVLNIACPTKLLALERAIELAKEDIPADKLHSAQFNIYADEPGEPLRLRFWYDADAPSRPVESVVKPKRRWWQFGRAA